MIWRAAGGIAARARRCYSSSSFPVSDVELGRLQNQLKRVPGSRAALVRPSAEPEGDFARKRVLAFLVGWTAGSLRAVAKHAEPYTKVGIPVVCIAPTILQVWITALGSRLSRSLLLGLDQSLEEPVSMVLHAFSAGPGVVLPALVSDFESGERQLTGKLNPACVVFDSGPACFSYEDGMAGARIIYEKGGFSFPVYLASVCGGISLNAVIGPRKRREMNTLLRSPLLDVPQLYLHSEIDPVAKPSHVRKVMLDQQAMGRDVQSHCWQNLEHVHLYIGDPMTYEHHVHSLLRKCQII